MKLPALFHQSGSPEDWRKRITKLDAKIVDEEKRRDDLRASHGPLVLKAEDGDPKAANERVKIEMALAAAAVRLDGLGAGRAEAAAKLAEAEAAEARAAYMVKVERVRDLGNQRFGSFKRIEALTAEIGQELAKIKTVHDEWRKMSTHRDLKFGDDARMLRDVISFTQHKIRNYITSMLNTHMKSAVPGSHPAWRKPITETLPDGDRLVRGFDLLPRDEAPPQAAE